MLGSILTRIDTAIGTSAPTTEAAARVEQED